MNKHGENGQESRKRRKKNEQICFEVAAAMII
jgi:hypothetical protein